MLVYITQKRMYISIITLNNYGHIKIDLTFFIVSIYIFSLTNSKVVGLIDVQFAKFLLMYISMLTKSAAKSSSM